MMTFLLLVLVIFAIAALIIADTGLHSDHTVTVACNRACLIVILIVIAVIVACGVFLGTIGFWIN